MIATISFRRFRALRDTHLSLGPFNLIIGPNGSGKTSLIDALTRLRSLARLPLRSPPAESEKIEEGPEIVFGFAEPFASLEATLGCLSDRQCDLLLVTPPPSGEPTELWPSLRARLLEIRAYTFEHRAISARASVRDGAELSPTGGNLAAVLLRWQSENRPEWTTLQEDFSRFFVEYDAIEPRRDDGSGVELWVRLRDEGTWIHADQLSQGTLYILALLALAHQPQPPTLVAIEEIDRGVHPRMLRQVRDALYRLCFPESHGLHRTPIQVLVTTHSPYLLDLFRDHPDEVIVSTKRRGAAEFTRLSDHVSWPEIVASEGSLGDLWYTGLLGGVPEDYPTKE